MNDIVPAPNSVSDKSERLKDNLLSMEHYIGLIRSSPESINDSNIEFIFKCYANEFDTKEAEKVFQFDKKVSTSLYNSLLTYIPIESDENIATIKAYAKDLGFVDLYDFWTIDKEGDMKFTLSDLVFWLEDRGIRSYIQGKNLAFLSIRSSKIIKEISVDQIRSIVNKYLIKKVDIRLRKEFIDKKDDYFTEPKLKALKEIHMKALKDTPDLCLFFFQNGYIEVTKYENDFKIKDFYNLDSVIWESQIISRPLQPKPSDEDIQNCDFARFLSLAMDQDQERISCATSAFCYLIHNYKSDSTTKAIVATDKAIGALNNESEGRTGKGLLFNRALRELVTTCVMEAPEQPTQFPYERVNEDTRCIIYDELPQNFSLRKFFTRLTTDLVINKKNRPEITIAYKDSPKFVICTNFPIKGDTGSTFDRLSMVEFGDYFSINRKPKDVFGREFFGSEWDDHEWNCFYWLVIGWMQDYLRHGLREVVSETNPYKRLVAQTCKDFADYVTMNELPISFSKAELRDEYMKFLGFDSNEVDANDFNKWLELFANIYKSIEFSTSLRKYTLIRQITHAPF